MSITLFQAPAARVTATRPSVIALHCSGVDYWSGPGAWSATPSPTKVITEQLPNLLPNCRTAVVDDAGHMGPMTYAAKVSSLVVRHIDAIEAREALVA